MAFVSVQEYVYNKLKFSYGWYFTFVQGLVYLGVISCYEFRAKHILNPWRTYCKLSPVLMGCSSFSRLQHPGSGHGCCSTCVGCLCRKLSGGHFFEKPCYNSDGDAFLVNSSGVALAHPTHGAKRTHMCIWYSYLRPVQPLLDSCLFFASLPSLVLQPHQWWVHNFPEVTTARKAVMLLLSYIIFTKPLSEQHYTGLILLVMGFVLKMMADQSDSKDS